MLNEAALPFLSGDIKKPTYDRSEITPGIFHFGVGGFHRSHQAVVMDNLFEDKSIDWESVKNWGICGVSAVSRGQLMLDLKTKQNLLYTLVEKAPNGLCSYRVIGSIVNCVSALESAEKVIESLIQEACKIVSLTITDYNINPSTKKFDLTNQSIRNDINKPCKPGTVVGIVAEALRIRKERGMKGFTIMSCDNGQGNGDIAKEAFTSYANAIDPHLALWMAENVTFPNSMVDRITPKTTAADRKATYEKLGVIDEYPVVCEPFFQWVLEDNFVGNCRPPFEKSATSDEKICVKLVKDVKPYEMMKLRLLNAGHQAITYFGLLMSFEYVHEAAKNDLIVEFLRSYMNFEASSTLQPLDEIEDYKNKVIQRFQNPHICDTLARLASKGSDRIFRAVMPVIVDRLAENRSILFSTAIVASYVCYLGRLVKTRQTENIPEDKRSELVSLSDRLHKDPKEIKDEDKILGGIVKDERFVTTFQEVFERIREDGAEKSLSWLLEEGRF